MKKFLAALCIFLCTCSLFGETIKVMSFNVEGNKGNHRITNPIWLNNICSIIKYSQADLILLQEFNIKEKAPVSNRNSKETREFCNKLGATWRVIFALDEKNPDQSNVIFYNSTKIIETHKDYSNYVQSFTTTHNQIAEFCIVGNSNKSFVVVNVHLPLYVKTGNNDKDTKKLEKYLNDLKQLETLYSSLKDQAIIIGGDFNTKRKTSSGKDAGEVLIKRFPDAIVDSNNSEFFLHTSGFEDGIIKIYPTLDIDHFIIKNLKIIKETHLYLGGGKKNDEGTVSIKIKGTTYVNRKEYEKNVSDHLPIMIELEL